MPLPDFLSSEVREGLVEGGFERLFPVQEQIYPHVVAAYNARVRYDVCVCSPTGSGKTLSYVLPIVESLRTRRVPQLRCIVVAPRKELAKQVFATFKLFAKRSKLVVQLASGEDLLRVDTSRYSARQPDVVVATPARLMELFQSLPGMTLRDLRYLVLDESDLLLADSTQDWLRGVLSKAEQDVQASGSASPPPLHRLLFSATLTHNVAKLNQARLVNPKHFMLASDGSTLNNVLRYAIPDTLEERVAMCGEGEKVLALRRILSEEEGTVLVFTKTTEAAHRLTRILQLMGAEADEFSGQLTPAQRAHVVQNLRLGVSTCGVCSDALARGIDVDRVSLVVNYEVPSFIQTYIHRVGRTARAGRAGSAVTLIESEEEREEFLLLRKKAAQSDTNPVTSVTIEAASARSGKAEPLRQLLADSLSALQDILSRERKGLLCTHSPLPEGEVALIRQKHATLMMGRKKELHRVLTEQSRKRKREGEDGDDDDDDDVVAEGEADGADPGSDADAASDAPGKSEGGGGSSAGD
eukprot:TRINITY_DN18087_c0_g1_i1.p1 TRINITY_DN18087_c0_g1~~TRINITY_DN18087_c0_g1_i1.p1  ORF type:complete len:526 (+),score=187.06 TRINITY_DN18087_c0_g1_i1:1106-2683(+)